jgi:hypothetical protein
MHTSRTICISTSYDWCKTPWIGLLHGGATHGTACCASIIGYFSAVCSILPSTSVTSRCLPLQVAEDRVAELRQELSVTKDELARATSVAGKAAAAEARLVKGEGMVPAGKIA